MPPAAKIAAALSKYGRPMLLRRRVGTSSIWTEVTVAGVSQGYAPQELVGGVVQGDRKITISNAEILTASWPGPPKKGDVLDGGAVQGCETKYLGITVLVHVCQVRG
ncbi:MAG: Azospirillum phage Cd [Pseudomonadota bacterium]|jgi:hypothetical protein